MGWENGCRRGLPGRLIGSDRLACRLPKTAARVNFRPLIGELHKPPKSRVPRFGLAGTGSLFDNALYYEDVKIDIRGEKGYKKI